MVIEKDAVVEVTLPLTANAPEVTVQAPNGGESISAETEIQWTATDSDGDNLTHTILYSADNGQSWTMIATGLTTTSYDWDPTLSPGGDQCHIRVVSSDGFRLGQDDSDGSFDVALKSPTAAILSPAASTS